MARSSGNFRLVATAVLAFIGGLGVMALIARHEEAPPSPSPSALPGLPPSGATGRNPYSPKILSDPNFLRAQQEGIEALERACRESGKYCADARAARDWLDRQLSKD